MTDIRKPALAGKIAIVTGGASGIGAATCRALDREGAAVVVTDINLKGAQQLASELAGEHGKAHALALDMGDAAEIADVAAQVIAAHGGIDIVVNNAVKTDPADGPAAEIDADTWLSQMTTNLIGPALLSKAAIPSMIARGGGSLVHIASAAGIHSEDTRTCYATAKSGLFALSRSIAVQYGKQGIRSNCIAPGLILTPAARATFSEEQLELLRQTHMTPDLGTPEQIADTVVYLCSAAAGFVTGHTLVADGGFTAAASIVPVMRMRR